MFPLRERPVDAGRRHFEVVTGREIGKLIQDRCQPSADGTTLVEKNSVLRVDRHPQDASPAFDGKGDVHALEAHRLDLLLDALPQAGR